MRVIHVPIAYQNCCQIDLNEHNALDCPKLILHLTSMPHLLPLTFWQRLDSLIIIVLHFSSK